MNRRHPRPGAEAALRRRLAVARVAVALGTAALASGAGLASAASAAPPPSLSVRAATLLAASSGQKLYGFDAYQSLPIASTTKLMTALLTLEHARLKSVFTAPAYYPLPAEVVIGLATGERMSVHDLLLAMLLPSANDAAYDLAYNVGHGSVARFVAMMNSRARQLGLVHTHYATPIGLDVAGNYSSAYDLVKLARYLRENYPFFVRAVALPSAVLQTGNRVRVVRNRNDLVARVSWVNGVKTGHTIDAGYVLVASGTRDGMTLLSAVLGTPSSASADENTLALLDYGFANFRTATPVRAGEVLARPRVQGQPGVHAAVIAAATFRRVIARSTRLTKRVVIPNTLAGPLSRHALVGHVIVLADGRPIYRVRLLLAKALPAATPAGAARFITRPSTLLSLFVLFSAAMALAVRRRLRTRQVGTEKAEPA